MSQPCFYNCGRQAEIAGLCRLCADEPTRLAPSGASGVESPPPALCLHDRVVSTLFGHVPLAQMPMAGRASPSSGLAISPNGRVVKVALYATDGGLKRPTDVWDAYLALAVALLREAGCPVIVRKPGLEISVAAPPVRREVA